MITTREDSRLSTETPATVALREALLRFSPGALTAEVGPIALVALLDDGTLWTVASVGSESGAPDSRSIWSESSWLALAREVHDLKEARLAPPNATTLLPITVDSVLYGALECSADRDVVQHNHVGLHLAAADLAPIVKATVRR